MSEVLSPLDTLFLHLDTPRTPMHMGSIGFFEAAPLTAPDGSVRIEELRAAIVTRLPLVPKLLRRPSRSPLWLLPPVWEDDPAFDVARHVHRVAVPPPGTEEQLLELSAEILSWPLDTRRPLWELWFVEGVQGGRVAVIEKLHHALADGLAGVELAAVLLDDRRHPAHGVTPPPAPAVRPPAGVVDVVARNFADAAARAQHRVAAASAALRHPGAALGRAADVAEGVGSLLWPAPVAPSCSVNRPIGRRRRVAVVRARLASLHAVAAQSGATVNDVLLTAVAGGMRELHLARGEALHDLHVLVPVGIDHGGSGALGNDVSAMVARLPLDEADPAMCLAHVAAASARRKHVHQADGASAVLSLLGLGLQPGVAAAAAFVQRQPSVHVVVTNVPGPARSLYSMGSRMLEAVPIVPLARNLSVGIAAFSYHGQLTVGIQADHQACPDVAVLADGIGATFDQLVRRARRGRHTPERRVRAVRPAPAPLSRPASGARAS